MQKVIPSLRRIRIYPADLRSAERRASGVACGFSGGIDSFSVLADHHYGDPPQGFRLTHLLYNNVGAHGRTGNIAFRLRYERLRPFADRIGLPFVAVDSNLMSLYDDLAFKLSYTLRNAAVSLLFQAGIGRAYHAAGTVLNSPLKPGPIKDVAHFDSMILPMISTEVLDAMWTGGGYTRVEKTLQVARIEDSYGVLYVCVRKDRAGNCSTCKKCVRTLLTLEIAGLLDRYADVFDVPAYRKHHGHVVRILRTDHQMSREIKSFARERGYRFPLWVRFLALARLDVVRDWLVGLAARTRRGGHWIRERKARRSPLSTR
jgi:hypothetical protein